MKQAITIGLDIAKHVFQAHGADAAGRHCQLSGPWYGRCVGGAAAWVGRSFARLLRCPALTEWGRKKAPWVR
jgi:hypothetical protein